MGMGNNSIPLNLLNSYKCPLISEVVEDIVSLSFGLKIDI